MCAFLHVYTYVCVYIFVCVQYLKGKVNYKLQRNSGRILEFKNILKYDALSAKSMGNCYAAYKKSTSLHKKSWSSYINK